MLRRDLLPNNNKSNYNYHLLSVLQSIKQHDDDMMHEKNGAWFRVDGTRFILGCSPDPRGALRCRNRSRNACNACTYTSRPLVVPVTYEARAIAYALHYLRTYVRRCVCAYDEWSSSVCDVTTRVQRAVYTCLAACHASCTDTELDRRRLSDADQAARKLARATRLSL